MTLLPPSPEPYYLHYSESCLPVFLAFRLSLFQSFPKIGPAQVLLSPAGVNLSPFPSTPSFPFWSLSHSFSESPAWTEVYFHLLDTPSSSWSPCQLHLLFLTFATHTSHPTTPQVSERKSKNLKNSGLGAAQLVEWFSSMYKALGSIPEPDKQNMVTHCCKVGTQDTGARGWGIQSHTD